MGFQIWGVDGREFLFNAREKVDFKGFLGEGGGRGDDREVVYHVFVVLGGICFDGFGREFAE